MRKPSSRRERRIAVTGLGAVTALGPDVPAFAAALRRGRTAVRALDPEELPALAPLRVAAPLVPFAWEERLASVQPDAAARARRVLRTGTRALRVTAAAVLEAAGRAGLLDGGPDPEGTGMVVAGSNLSRGYVVDALNRFARQPAWIPARYGVQMFDSHWVGALSAVLPAHAAGFTVGAGAASGNAAVAAAVDLIRAGRAERVVVAGPMIDFSALEWQALAKIGALATGSPELPPEAWSRPFDAAANGFVPGEGAAAVVLEDWDGARARGAEPLAEVLAAELVLDGTELPTPSAGGERRVMERALARGRVAPGEVGLVSAHGTSTPAGDAAEAAAIRAVFAGSPGPLVNALKGLAGHTFFAAGLLGLVAVVEQIRGGFVHGNAGLDRPAAEGLRLCGAAAVDARIDRALNNAFGFGGFNACVAVGRVE